MKKATCKSIFMFVLALSFLSVPFVANAEDKKSILYPKGYCTWYVADNNSFYVAFTTQKNWGNAINWFDKAQGAGFKTKDRGWKPKKYSMVVLKTGKPEGHIALVNKVESSKFRVTEMNWTGWNKVSERWYSKTDSNIKGFILTKKAVEEYKDDDKKEYDKLKKQYQKYGIWYDGKKQ